MILLILMLPKDFTCKCWIWKNLICPLPPRSNSKYAPDCEFQVSIESCDDLAWLCETNGTAEAAPRSFFLRSNTDVCWTRAERRCESCARVYNAHAENGYRERYVYGRVLCVPIDTSRLIKPMPGGFLFYAFVPVFVFRFTIYCAYV
jgi:hypothetical protein